MTIYDGLIEMREAGMNSTSLVFVNMISSSFLIQPIMINMFAMTIRDYSLLMPCLISWELIMVYLACQHAIKMVVMWYDGVVSSFE